MRLLIAILFPLFLLGQTDKLKPEFKNLSWIIDSKAAEVISTLSFHYGNKSLINDSLFVTKDQYDLYFDSLTLWKMTKDAYKENDTRAKSTLVGGFTEAATKHSNKEWLRIYDAATRNAYAENGNSTSGDNSCVPSSYENLKLFYKEESQFIKSYNHGRIKLYQFTSISNSDYLNIHDTIKFYLLFHKTIKPTENNGVCYYGTWMPYVYIYPKPKKAVHLASNKKIWESKTGLSYDVAQELFLTDDRINKILNLLGKVNDEVLIKEPLISREYNVSVDCDTCDVKLFDNHNEDNDIIKFTYKGESQQTIIKNNGSNYKIIISEDYKFYITAISEGTQETCTVDAIINGKNHIFALKKGEKILIKLIKI